LPLYFLQDHLPDVVGSLLHLLVHLHRDCLKQITCTSPVKFLFKPVIQADCSSLFFFGCDEL
jgi:hypothetical protein